MGFVDLRKTGVTGTLVEAARGFLRTPEADASPVIEQERYKRLLDHELDKQHLTAVEREDSDMLDRVRSALYED